MIPLSDRLRPTNLDGFIGQKHLVSEGKLLRTALSKNQIFSMIFWGPPGVGKTTLARVIAHELDAEFLEFSAVTTGIAELKKIFEEKSRKQLQLDQKQVIIFIDEIHRFSKSQQDAFLPFVENGTITLIGATTENPSFEIIGPLLSRSRVLVLEKLSDEDLEEVVSRALKDDKNGLGLLRASLKKDALDFLIEQGSGDARVILNTLELAVNFAEPLKSGKRVIEVNHIQEAFQKKALLYDKHSSEHHDTISAFIKSMRASNIDSALYYLARMVEAGEDPLFIARRMVVFASEDVGLVVPTALVVANEVFRACETIGYPECQINLAHGVAYLASCKKDRSAYNAYFEALEDVKRFGNLPIPMEIRNAPTKLMKDLGYGKGYEMYSDKDLLPEKLKGKKYFKK